MIGAYVRFCQWVGVLPRWYALGLVCAWAGGFCLGYTHFGTRPLAQLEIPGQVFGILVLVPNIQAMHAQSRDAEARARGYWEKSVRIWVPGIMSFFLMVAGVVLGQLLSPA